MSGKNQLITALAAPLLQAGVAALSGFLAGRVANAPTATRELPPVEIARPVLASEWKKRHPDEAAEIANAEGRAAAAERQALRAEKRAQSLETSVELKTKRREKIVLTLATLLGSLSPFIAANIPFFHGALQTICNASGLGGG